MLYLHVMFRGHTASSTTYHKAICLLCAMRFKNTVSSSSSSFLLCQVLRDIILVSCSVYRGDVALLLTIHSVGFVTLCR